MNTPYLTQNYIIPSDSGIGSKAVLTVTTPHLTQQEDRKYLRLEKECIRHIADVAMDKNLLVFDSKAETGEFTAKLIGFIREVGLINGPSGQNRYPIFNRFLVSERAYNKLISLKDLNYHFLFGYRNTPSLLQSIMRGDKIIPVARLNEGERLDQYMKQRGCSVHNEFDKEFIIALFIPPNVQNESKFLKDIPREYILLGSI
jgi:hypothetical protein